ncbi:hypothetical protein [Natrialba sp. SSL1]|uniref:hypothetical protein n=1 Tax=Natrialba sp. SSL1 TaxID=1869245 RepID=UPI0008F86EFD|nr:hypothetical protein [Natrialba sp. SSL1]OIB57748.1 hypothetical protein BBD46_13290 [Natrialba sp. SSL1]
MEVDVDLPTEPGKFVVRTAIGETARESNIADKHGDGCISVQVWVGPDEVPSILTRHDGTACLE